MLDVTYSNQAQKFLKSIDNDLLKRIFSKIEELRATPVIHDTKSIHGYGEKLFRVRVGDYRILYEIDYSTKMIGIVKIDKRSRVY